MGPINIPLAPLTHFDDIPVRLASVLELHFQKFFCVNRVNHLLKAVTELLLEHFTINVCCIHVVQVSMFLLLKFSYVSPPSSGPIVAINSKELGLKAVCIVNGLFLCTKEYIDLRKRRDAPYIVYPSHSGLVSGTLKSNRKGDISKS